MLHLKVVYVLPTIYLSPLFSFPHNVLANQPFIQQEKNSRGEGTTEGDLLSTVFLVKEISLDTVPEELDFLLELLPS